MLLTCLAVLALPLPSVTTPHVGDAFQSPDVRLVVVLNVDSLFPDQLNRLAVHWTGGFKRLMQEGTSFPDAALPYGTTLSGPGYASFGSGSIPADHGIHRDATLDPKSSLLVPFVSDADAQTVSSSDLSVAGNGSASGKRLEKTGWAAALRAEWPESRSVSIGARGEAATLLGGKTSSLAIWWDSYGRGFVSSSAYVTKLPEWLANWNQSWPALASGWTWDAPDANSLRETGTALDDRGGEGSVAGRDPVFPYPSPPLPAVLTPQAQASLAGYAFATPLMDELVCDAARAAIRGAALGQDAHVDLLAISLSSAGMLCDATGPYSLEVTDSLLRSDAQLGLLFEALDQDVGEGKWTVVMSSNHGTLELPEGGRGEAHGGVRLKTRARRVALQVMRQHLRDEFGQDFGANMTTQADVVSFRPGSIAAAGEEVSAAGVREVAARALRTLPWVAGTYTREQLMSKPLENDPPMIALYRNSFRPDGGVDVQVRLAHRHLIGVLSGTRSGSPYLYDRRQPLVFLGPGFEPGAVRGPASSVDALATVLGRLGVALKGHSNSSDLLRR